jgi:exodeoxyribonuclease VII large subunit
VQLKRSINTQPRAIGVITSLAAAALHDVLTTLARRAPHVPVIVYPASVQGRDAPVQLRQALAKANDRQEVGVILLVRGGGSLEDLWAFNDESLARDIASSEIPVICGVGHESDVSIADFAADLRAPTPTAAAELCCISSEELLMRVQGAFERLHGFMQRRLDRLGQRLDQLTYGLVSPSQRLAQQAQKLSRLEQRLHALRPDIGTRAARIQALQVALSNLAERKLHRADAQLKLAHARLLTLAPQATLARGFAIVRDAQGQLVRESTQLTAGQAFNVELAKGHIDAQVVASHE